MARVFERLGFWVLPRELEDIGLESTPQYDPYEDEIQNEWTSPQLAEELDPMPEVDDHYTKCHRLRSGFLICEHCINAVVFKKAVYSRDISFWH